MVLFYSLEEAAAILGVSTADLRNKTRSGEIRAFLRGGIWRLRISEIHEIARRQGLLDVQPVEAIPPSNPAGPAPLIAPAPISPASPPVRAPITNETIRTSSTPSPAANPFEFPKIVVSPSSHSRETTPAAKPGTAEPPARTAPVKAKDKGNENDKLIHAIDRYNRPIEQTTAPKIEAVIKPPRPPLTLEPPKPLEIPATPVSVETDDSKVVEDILEQVESFIEGIEKSGDPEVDVSSTLADKATPAIRKQPRKKAGEAGKDWGQLLDSALEAEEQHQAESAKSAREAQAASAITPSPVPVATSSAESSSDFGEHSSTENGLDKPVVARGFFPIQCPNPQCKEYGQVPIGSLYDQLKCAKCSTPFYVDRYSNAVVPGVRVVGKPSWMRASPSSVKVRGPSKFEKGFDKWMRASPKDKVLGLSKFAAVLLVGYLVYFFWPRVPNTPDARTREVIAALDRNEPGRVRAIALADSSEAVEAWFNKVRANSWPKTPSQPPPTSKLLYSRKNKKRATAATVITVSGPVGSGPKSEASLVLAKSTNPTLPAKAANAAISAKSANKRSELTPQLSNSTQIQLFWVKDSSDWLFDANATLRAGEATPPK